MQCLVIDDDRDSRYLFAEMASSCGYLVSEAEDGEIALAICKQSMPDIILLDWMMPSMNGIEFLERLNHDTINTTKPFVVMCSAKFGHDDVEKGLAAGASEYVKKPVRMRDVKAILEAHQKREC